MVALSGAEVVGGSASFEIRPKKAFPVAGLPLSAGCSELLILPNRPPVLSELGMRQEGGLEGAAWEVEDADVAG